MNGLLAKAGSVFLAPAPAAPVVRRPPVPVPDLVGVLAAPADLACVAGGVAAALRRRHRAKTVLVCGFGAAPGGPPPTLAARALAARLAARELASTAAGFICHVGLSSAAEETVRDAWRAITAAAGSPAVVILTARSEATDALLAQTDLLLLAAGADRDETLVELALGSLAALGPPAELARPPAGFLARRLAASGLRALALAPEGTPA